MTRATEDIKALERAVEAIEGMVLQLRGDALLPGGDGSFVINLDCITEKLMEIRAELSAVRSRARWCAQHSRRRR